jgi:hypothetical protein
MRRPPDKRKARRDPGLSKHARVWIGDYGDEVTPLGMDPQAVFTVVPAGRAWRVKTITAAGDVAYLESFDDRLRALGAALLLSARAGGRAMP